MTKDVLALDYAWKLISYIIIVPILINVALSGFLHIMDPWLTVLSFVCNTVAMFFIKKALNSEYGELYDNPLLFAGAVFLVAIILWCLCGVFGITVFTIIGTIAGMLIAFIGLDNIKKFVRGIVDSVTDR